jgi:hypothetical protein
MRLFLAMRFLILCLGAVFVSGGQPHLACPPFIVYTQSEFAFSDAIWTPMKNEVESILSPTGWEVRWEDAVNAARSISVTLAVVRFQGACHADDLLVSSPGGALLGRTHVVNGVIISFADVFCDAIRESVASRLSMMNADDKDRWFGRAVGRVVAHELYHILTREKHHGSRGVAQARFSQEELLSDDFRFDTKQVRSLRRTLAPVVLSAFEWPDTQHRQNLNGAALFISSGCSGCHGVLAGGTPWGPPLRAGVDAAALVRRLKNSDAVMYRRAKDMRLLWPPLARNEVGEIAIYLNSFRNPGAAQAQSDMSPGWK